LGVVVVVDDYIYMANVRLLCARLSFTCFMTITHATIREVKALSHLRLYCLAITYQVAMQ
jgi:hypothetical protein